MTRSTAPRAPATAPVVRYGVEWFAGGAWSASACTWETRREAAVEAAAWCVRSAEARVVLLATVPMAPAPGPRRLTDAD